MPITMNEAARSSRIETISNEVIPVEYDLFGSTDKFAIEAHIKANAPSTVGGLPITGITLENEDGFEDAWRATVTYSDLPIIETDIGDTLESFQTGGSSSRIFAALEHIASYGTGVPDAVIPDHHGAINVTEDRVEGTEIVIRSYAFTIRKKYESSSIDGTFKGHLFQSTGKVNHATYMGFAKGELLFVGANGTQQTQDTWEIDFSFMASPNETDLEIGDITVSAKEGWHFLWVEFEDVEDATANRLVKRPLAAHVERVYQYHDLSVLGLV